MTTDDETGPEAQMQAAMEAIRAAALRLLQEGEVDPQLVMLAAARVTGELGASAALVDGMDPEAILGDLADFVRHAGREHAKTLRAEALPVAGSA
jgi:hypothetical protein